MKYIQSRPNPSGAYSAPVSHLFTGCIPLSDEQAAVLVQYNGFVTIVPGEADVETGVVRETEVVPNMEAWEAWKASLPTDPEEERVDG